MRNFAEEMAYWYFRFNGFFVLDNFVLHNDELNSIQSADIDILGIRQKHTYENIGGRGTDTHHILFDHFDDDKHIGIVCEVKSGKRTTNKIHLKRLDRLRYGISRIGFFSQKKVEGLALKLAEEPVVKGKYHQIGKVIVTEDGRRIPGFICITLEQIHDFLRRHLKKYIDPKGRSKHFFPSPVLQQIIWEIEHEKKNVKISDKIPNRIG